MASRLTNFNIAELRDVLQINLILPPDEIGPTGFIRKSDNGFEYNRVRDPATGLKRRFSFHHPFWINAELDYDIPEGNLRLGATCHDDARDFDDRINEITSRYHGIKLSAFFRDRDMYAGCGGVSPGPGRSSTTGRWWEFISSATSRLILKYYFNGSLPCRLC